MILSLLDVRNAGQGLGLREDDSWVVDGGLEKISVGSVVASGVVLVE